MKLYFVRHGESEANLLQEFSNRGLKHGLTEKGKQQATLLAQTLKSSSISKILSSPLLRATQTAEILERELCVPYETADALREYDCGILEGRSDAASWQRYYQLWDAWIWHQEWDKRIEEGESLLDIQRRFVPFIERLIQEYQSSAGSLVLVGHGGTYRCMLPLILSNVDFRFAVDHPMDHTAAVVAEVKPTGLVCVTWSGTVLLSE